MSVVKVDAFGGEALERADKVLSSVPDGVKKAINSAMPRAVTELRKKSSERIRERYAISDKNIRSEETVKVSYQTGNGVIASVRFSGRKIPLYRFDGSRPKSPIYDKNDLVRGYTSKGWRMLPKGRPAYGHVLIGTSPALFEHAFTATMSNGHTGIFSRDGTGIEEIMGASVAQMVGNDEVAEKLVKDASDKFEERIEHEITRILNGWGK